MAYSCRASAKIIFVLDWLSGSCSYTTAQPRYFLYSESARSRRRWVFFYTRGVLYLAELFPPFSSLSRENIWRIIFGLFGRRSSEILSSCCSFSLRPNRIYVLHVFFNALRFRSICKQTLRLIIAKKSVLCFVQSSRTPTLLYPPTFLYPLELGPIIYAGISCVLHNTSVSYLLPTKSVRTCELSWLPIKINQFRRKIIKLGLNASDAATDS